jgi:hypothetical protein
VRDAARAGLERVIAVRDALDGRQERLGLSPLLAARGLRGRLRGLRAARHRRRDVGAEEGVEREHEAHREGHHGGEEPRDAAPGVRALGPRLGIGQEVLVLRRDAIGGAHRARSPRDEPMRARNTTSVFSSR